MSLKQTYRLPDDLSAKVKSSLEESNRTNLVRRLWAGDATLWTNSDESKWLGWLKIAGQQLDQLDKSMAIARDVQSAGFTHALLLGMGGSSLCPEVMQKTFGHIPGSPQLLVLDSTDPAQIASIEKKIDLRETLFIVSSKSGSTLEPNIFKQYFFERVREVVGDQAGSRFIAITDPDSKMEQVAGRDAFRHILHGLPDIGGRYSALSNFGVIPAAIMGVDLRKFLERTMEMVKACSTLAPDQNPGVLLGTILGIAARNGRDKVTLIASPAIYDLGAWLEQLIAESTGKNGKALIPVDREAIGEPSLYGDDRVFVYLRFEPSPDTKQDASVQTLEKAGQPVITIPIADRYDLGQEFFRWEIATAVAGSIIRINPFDQPDVEAAKVATRALTEEYERSGSIGPEKPLLEESGLKLFTDNANALALRGSGGGDNSAVGLLKAHLARIKPGDYFAVLAFIEMNEANERQLQELRHAVRDRKRVATCLGFGPRFLHSTGQAHKGGPNTGVFLQITCDDAIDLPVPEQRYTFGVVKAAQARGDFQVLAERGRRILRVHLGPDVQVGLQKLQRLVVAAL